MMNPIENLWSSLKAKVKSLLRERLAAFMGVPPEGSTREEFRMSYLEHVASQSMDGTIFVLSCELIWFRSWRQSFAPTDSKIGIFLWSCWKYAWHGSWCLVLRENAYLKWLVLVGSHVYHLMKHFAWIWMIKYMKYNARIRIKVTRGWILNENIEYVWSIGESDCRQHELILSLTKYCVNLWN